jgi:hypothetical protein
MDLRLTEHSRRALAAIAALPRGEEPARLLLEYSDTVLMSLAAQAAPLWWAHQCAAYPGLAATTGR